jgi:hypothetical protein
MTLTPFLVPAFVFCINLCRAYFADCRHKKFIIPLFLMLVFSQELALWVYDTSFIVGRDKTRLDLIAVGKTIDQNTNPGDTIISLGFPCQIYPFTERQSASCYIYQTSGASYDPNMQTEFLTDIERNKPKIIAIRNQEGSYEYLPDWYAPVYDLIAKDYRFLSAENGFYLFILRSA